MSLGSAPAAYAPDWRLLMINPPRADSIEHGGRSPYFPDMQGVSPATLYNAGGYAEYVDRMFELRPRPPAQKQRVRWYYSLNYNMQPHYGQQYPDRAPPGTGLDGLNSRAFGRERGRSLVVRPT